MVYDFDSFFLVPCVFLMSYLKRALPHVRSGKCSLCLLLGLSCFTRVVLASVHYGYKDIILLHCIFPGTLKNKREKKERGRGEERGGEERRRRGGKEETGSG